MRKSRVDLNMPPVPNTLRVQLALNGKLADEVRKIMVRYDMEQAAVVRMLIIDGVESRLHRNGNNA